VKADPANGAYRDALGWTLYQLDRYPEAVVELGKAVEPGQWLRYDHLGDAYKGLSCQESARDACKGLSCQERARDAWHEALTVVLQKEKDAVDRNDVHAAMDMQAQSIRLATKLTEFLPAAGKPSTGAPSPVPSPCRV
jgi:hypothetical protein